LVLWIWDKIDMIFMQKPRDSEMVEFWAESEQKWMLTREQN
jgi:hypothetical protein